MVAFTVGKKKERQPRPTMDERPCRQVIRGRLAVARLRCISPTRLDLSSFARRPATPRQPCLTASVLSRLLYSRDPVIRQHCMHNDASPISDTMFICALDSKGERSCSEQCVTRVAICVDTMSIGVLTNEEITVTCWFSSVMSHAAPSESGGSSMTIVAFASCFSCNQHDAIK